MPCNAVVAHTSYFIQIHTYRVNPHRGSVWFPSVLAWKNTIIRNKNFAEIDLTM